MYPDMRNASNALEHKWEIKPMHAAPSNIESVTSAMTKSAIVIG